MLSILNWSLSWLRPTPRTMYRGTTPLENTPVKTTETTKLGRQAMEKLTGQGMNHDDLESSEGDLDEFYQEEEGENNGMTHESMQKKKGIFVAQTTDLPAASKAKKVEFSTNFPDKFTSTPHSNLGQGSPPIDLGVTCPVSNQTPSIVGEGASSHKVAKSENSKARIFDVGSQSAELTTEEGIQAQVGASDRQNTAWAANMGDETRPERPYKHKQKDPAYYDGGSTEWIDYIEHFEEVAEWNGWSPYEKTQQLAMSLRGQAQRVLGDLPKAKRKDYSSLKNALAARFNPLERETSFRAEFQGRDKTSQELWTMAMIYSG